MGALGKSAFFFKCIQIEKFLSEVFSPKKARHGYYHNECINVYLTVNCHIVKLCTECIKSLDIKCDVVYLLT